MAARFTMTSSVEAVSDRDPGRRDIANRSSLPQQTAGRIRAASTSRQKSREASEDVASGWLTVAAGAQQPDRTRQVLEDCEHRRTPPDRRPGQAHGARAVVLRGFSAGFTLPELVIVLVLIGIVAAFAAPRLDVTGFERQIFADELTNGLRYTRKVALNSGCPIRVDVSPGADSVSVAYTGAGGAACPAGPLPHPSRGGDFVLNGEIDAGGSVVFDAFGRAQSELAITLASGERIVIELGTGYVHR